MLPPNALPISRPAYSIALDRPEYKLSQQSAIMGCTVSSSPEVPPLELCEVVTCQHGLWRNIRPPSPVTSSRSFWCLLSPLRDPKTMKSRNGVLTYSGTVMDFVDFLLPTFHRECVKGPVSTSNMKVTGNMSTRRLLWKQWLVITGKRLHQSSKPSDALEKSP